MTLHELQMWHSVIKRIKTIKLQFTIAHYGELRTFNMKMVALIFSVWLHLFSDRTGHFVADSVSLHFLLRG